MNVVSCSGPLPPHPPYPPLPNTGFAVVENLWWAIGLLGAGALLLIGEAVIRRPRTARS